MRKAMFDHVPPTVFWPCFALAWLLLIFFFVWAWARFVDRTNPYSNIEARKKMASDWRKPGCLPENWK
jgi:hypothetical protein